MNNYKVRFDDLWRETDLFGADRKHKGVGAEI